MKKRKVELPCFLCDKAGEICDKERPCGRCVRMNIPHMCIGAELNSGAALNHIVRPVPSAVPQQRVAPLRTQFAAPEKQTVSPISSPQKQNFNQNITNGPTSPIKPVQSNSPQTPQTTPPSSPTVTTSNKPAETNGTILQSNRNMNIISGERLSNPFENNPKVNEPTNASAPVPGYQMNINSFLMAEMKKLKEDQQRLNDEVLTLKLQNLKLTAQLDNFASTLPKLSNFQLLLGSADAQKAMAVFDLRKAGTVLTANDTFCAMFGYNLEEVIGKNWTVFIPKEYIDKTMQIVSTATLSQPTVQFEQVYVHKDGAYFSTWDTHTIFFSNGQPVSDVVFITLAPSTNGYTPSTPPPQPIRSRNLLSLEGRAPSVTTPGFSVVDTPPATPAPSSYTVTTPNGTIMDTVDGNSFAPDGTFHPHAHQPHISELIDLPFDDSQPRVESLDPHHVDPSLSTITDIHTELPVLDMADWVSMPFLADYVPDSPPLSTDPHAPTTKQPFTFLPQ